MQTEGCRNGFVELNSCTLYPQCAEASPFRHGEKNCAGCQQIIVDRSFLLVENNYWHLTCLNCCACAVTLDGSQSCFVKEGRVYCRHDYQRLFSSQACSHCGVFIEPHELVMRVHEHVYHANYKCFSCCVCQRPLTTGQQFVADHPNLICLNCCNNEHQESEYFDINLHKPGRPKKRKQMMTSSHLDSMGGMTVNYVTDELRGDTERLNFPPHKSKRMRTSFKHHQLRAMKAYFHQNHNPDAKDLKQLAQETGLTKRVLQVWFQNARAKYRRGRAQQDKSGSQALTKSTGNDVTKPMCESVVAPDSNCSYSITSSIGTSPGSDSYLYDVSSSCEDLREGKMSPNPNYHSQPLSNQASPLYHQIPYSDAQYMGSTTSLQSIPTTPTLSSTLKSVQAAITSPCSM